MFVLEKGASLAPPASILSAAPLPRRQLWQRVTALTGGALLVAAVATTLTCRHAPGAAAPPRVSRLQVQSSGIAALTINGNDRDLAITPDGSRVVYVGNNGTQLFVRALEALEPVAVFTGAPRGPFVSPDAMDRIHRQRQHVEEGGVDRRAGSHAATLDGLPRGATWGPDDAIIVATDTQATGLQRVAATGGPTTVLTRPDRARGEADFSRNGCLVVGPCCSQSRR